ncbi:MAG TPA: hypothetical protein VH643_23345 [Gemmataceae bacterium]
MNSRSAIFPPVRQRALVLWLAVVFLCGGAAIAQQGEPTLRLGGFNPGGVRTSVTTRWATLNFEVSNFTDIDRKARVLVFYKDQPQVHYGRDIWVPARSSLRSWMLIGPAPADLPGLTREIEMVVEDLSQGKNAPLLPRTEERIRSRGVLYRPREPFTVILLDREIDEHLGPGQLPQPESQAEEAVRTVHVVRHARNLSDVVQRIDPGLLPPTAEAFDSVDHVVLASGRLTRDPVGMAALRHWTEQGGKVWVMLDLVEPEGLAPLLGDALDFQVVDRVGLTRFRVQTHPAGKGAAEPPLQSMERPVDFVRVQLPPEERVRHTIDGWPLWFTRRLGRGEVIFTTLGARAWHRPRTQRDPPSRYQFFPALPVGTYYLDDLGVELHPSGKESPFRIESLQPLLKAEIGYSVVRRNTVVLVFGAALLAALAVGFVLRKSSRRELLGWLGPVAALSATAIFLLVGELSRRATPPTVAAAQIVEPVSGTEEIAVHGLLEVYRPETGPIEAGVERGGMFRLDDCDMPNQVHQFVLTDLDAWHWERFSMLAEPRLASFHITLPADKPIVARTRFGPAGVEGELSGPFQNLSDALLYTPTGRKLAVHIEPDGAFRADAADVLSKGQYLAGTVLTDRQQRRQELYAAFLQEPEPASVRGRNVLLAWADPLDLHFHIAPGARAAGSALVVAPLRLERPAAGARVTIPGPFLPYQRILEGVPTRPTLESSEDIEMQLRFQLPAEVLPFQVERARLSAKIEAPGRRVAVAGQDGDRFTEIHRVDSPLDPVRVEIAEARMLRVDGDGGLNLKLIISNPSKPREPGGTGNATPPRGGRDRPTGGRSPAAKSENWGEKWTIGYLELEVSGQAIAEGR